MGFKAKLLCVEDRNMNSMEKCGIKLKKGNVYKMVNGRYTDEDGFTVANNWDSYELWKKYNPTIANHFKVLEKETIND